MSDEVRVAQTALYGAPLSEVLRRCGQVLGLNQAELARALGISAPMLSQLINAHRVKIANPLAAARLQAMNDAVDAVEAGRMDVSVALAAVAAVQAGGELLSTRRTGSSAAPADQLEAALQRVATSEEYLSAAEALAETHPGVSELLRLLGSGRAGRLLGGEGG
ncbi:helix-turn-helix domain-containing protein [Desertihabitans aurantiacus]|uniref:DNA-binding protein n=1 Tax=Desertihabitans aurantiacus TaxID=2282477 RepID=UPI000DF7CB68|nr:DNA-binding protein [Desertihabitans aurantiacus]